MRDLQVLENQRLESERKLQSIMLTKDQKEKHKAALESRLHELTQQTGSMRAEYNRAREVLSANHRKLLAARDKSDASRAATEKFGTKLKRVIGVARILGTYQNKIEQAMIALNETETRLNFVKGQTMSKLDAATVRRDDAKHKHELLLKAISSNTAKERSISEDISKVRAEMASNEQDLSAAQQMESQTKLRVETIEHEMDLERTRHTQAMQDLESKSRDLDETKVKTRDSIEAKRAAIEAKKAELKKIWAKCDELRKSEGHDTFPEPNWGAEQAPSLDVARVRVRANAEEVELNAKKAEVGGLRADVSELDERIASNAAKAAEKRARTDEMLKANEEARVTEARRKQEIQTAVEEADAECREVEKLRESIKELKHTQEANANELKMKLEEDKRNIIAMSEELKATHEETAQLEKQIADHNEAEATRRAKLHEEITESKKMADFIKFAFERAQKKATDFAALPDEDLALEMKRLDEKEKVRSDSNQSKSSLRLTSSRRSLQEIMEKADRERQALFDAYPILSKLQLDFNSDVPIEQQKEEGMRFLRKHCLESLKAAKAERQLRVEALREAHFARLKEEEEAEEARRREEVRCKEFGQKCVSKVA